MISTDVLRELDGLKLNSNQEIAYKARRAAILISKNWEGLKFDHSLDDTSEKVDDKLLELAKSYAGELITNDVYLKIKANAYGIRNSGYGGVADYTGVYYWNVEDVDENHYSKELDLALSEKVAPERFGLKENQYVIALMDNEAVGTFVYRNEVLEPITNRAIKNKWTGKITPRNPEQTCLFEALSQKDITVLYAGGPQGVGKSFLVNNYAL